MTQPKAATGHYTSLPSPAVEERQEEAGVIQKLYHRRTGALGEQGLGMGQGLARPSGAPPVSSEVLPFPTWWGWDWGQVSMCVWLGVLAPRP
jgi:hypothetical protein